MATVFSGVQPSGDFHLGNYLGAFKNWVAAQGKNEAYFCVVDLHALTLEIEPEELRRRTLESAVMLLAVGLDPGVVTLFVQSHVAEHTQLAWLLECTATDGELRRMTQYKDKASRGEMVRAGLLTYPVLMAADILLYQVDEVPVGDDQRQHLELTRDVAIRFNNRYGTTFTVPRATVPELGARVMDLQHPTNKMSKSVDSPMGTIGILDDPADVERKIMRAVTDTAARVGYDPEHKPGVSNLLELLAVANGEGVEEVAARYDRYGELKRDVADAVLAMLSPVRARALELSSDLGEVERILAAGAARAREVAAPTYAAAARAIGLTSP